MSTPIKSHHNPRQLSVIESAYSQEADSTTDRHHSSEACTERRDFAMADPSPSSSSSSFTPSAADSAPNNLSSAISSLNLSPSRSADARDDARKEEAGKMSKDLEKGGADTLSSDGSDPKIAEVADQNSKQDPFAQEAEGGMQYRTMAWWYGSHLFPPFSSSSFPPPL
jgi:hypothetical protein